MRPRWDVWVKWWLWTCWVHIITKRICRSRLIGMYRITIVASARMVHDIWHLLFCNHVHYQRHQWMKLLCIFVVMLLDCEGFDAIWVVVNRLSTISFIFPCHTIMDAPQVGIVIQHGYDLPAGNYWDNCFRSRTSICVSILGTTLNTVGDREAVVNGSPFTNRWTNRKNQWENGTVPGSVCKLASGWLGTAGGNGWVSCTQSNLGNYEMHRVIGHIRLRSPDVISQ
jgi:hypothetical protein